MAGASVSRRSRSAGWRLRPGVGLGVLLAVAAGAGCGHSDEDKLRELFDEVGKDPAALCDRGTDNFLSTEWNGKDDCLRDAADDKPKPVKVGSIELSGERAKVRVAFGEQSPLNFVLLKRDGQWRVERIG